MKKFLALALLLSALPAHAQFPQAGQWTPQYTAPVEITGTTYTIGPAAPVILVNSQNGIAITLPPCWAGQHYDLVLGGQASTIGQALFTASGTGTSLSVTSVNSGTIAIGSVIAGTGIPPGTTIISQSSGTSGSTGIYLTSQATTSNAALVLSGAITVSPGGSDQWLNGTTGALWLGSNGLHVGLTAVGSPGATPSCSWVAN